MFVDLLHRSTIRYICYSSVSERELRKRKRMDFEGQPTFGNRQRRSIRQCGTSIGDHHPLSQNSLSHNGVHSSNSSAPNPPSILPRSSTTNSRSDRPEIPGDVRARAISTKETSRSQGEGTEGSSGDNGESGEIPGAHPSITEVRDAIRVIQRSIAGERGRQRDSSSDHGRESFKTHTLGSGSRYGGSTVRDQRTSCRPSWAEQPLRERRSCDSWVPGAVSQNSRIKARHRERSSNQWRSPSPDYRHSYHYRGFEGNRGEGSRRC